MSRKPRIVGPASELAGPERYCTHCNKALRGRVAWLEFDQRTQTYHDDGGVPSDKSQGWFPFGVDCARAELNRRIAA